MHVRFRWTGFSPAFRRLNKLEKVKAKAIWRKALRAGATILLKAARELVPTRSKMLRRSLAIRIKSRRRDGVIIAIVGPRQKFEKVINGRKVKPSNYAHLVEGGRKQWRKGNRAAGEVAARSFLGKASVAQRRAIFAAIVEKINKELAQL